MDIKVTAARPRIIVTPLFSIFFDDHRGYSSGAWA